MYSYREVVVQSSKSLLASSHRHAVTGFYFSCSQRCPKVCTMFHHNHGIGLLFHYTYV